jgi:hypothetical protein
MSQRRLRPQVEPALITRRVRDPLG